jgi:polyisoprenoid-binding protein YceI
MRGSLFGPVRTALATVALLALVAAPARADDFVLDPDHSSVSFMIDHLGLTSIHGRFNAVAGDFVIDKANPGKSSFTLTLKTESIDTNNAKRDAHLRSPDFFNAKQYPQITFKSTAVKPAAGGYDVTGDFTMNGKTKSISFTLKGGKTLEFPKGTQRIGFTTFLTVRRGDFGVGKAGFLGDEVQVAVGFEGTQKK